MKTLEAGQVVDGFLIGERVHSGSMAQIYRVTYAQGHRPDPGFPMVMKVPRMTAGDGAETIVSFEVEHQIMGLLQGAHVPRLVASGDLSTLPYLVMEYVEGQTLQHWLDNETSRHPAKVAALGASIARAVHQLHQQHVCHLDLKPANVLIRPDQSVVLLDFGLSCHAHQPDLLAEELRLAIGSPAWIAPEQIVGVRGDVRSDVFAMGVMLYEMITGELPFGAPRTPGGMRQRLWMEPTPPRRHAPDTPEWLQEVVLRCLAPAAADRYPSAAHLAFDLTHPDQVHITDLGRRVQSAGVWAQFKRWLHAAGMQYQPSPLPQQQLSAVPIVMVAVPHKDVTDATLFALREAVGRSLGIRPGARLACVTVIGTRQVSTTEDARSETTVHRHHLHMLKQWAQGLPLDGHQVSFHVLEASDVAHALLEYAEGNHVTLMVMGAATHGLQMQRLVATVPIRVAMDAPCSVLLVKQSLPFEQLSAAATSAD